VQLDDLESPVDATCRQRLGAARDLADPRQEDEDVAGSAPEQVDRRVRDGALERLAAPQCDLLDVDRKGATRRGEDRRAAEKPRDRLGLERRRHHDDPEVGPRVAPDPFDQREREIGVEAALVELVEEDQADIFEERVVLEHAHQDPLRDDEQPGARAGSPLEADLVADLVAEPHAALGAIAARAARAGEPPRLEDDDRRALRRAPRVERAPAARASSFPRRSPPRARGCRAPAGSP
jgi:hypothetical protein